MRKLYKKSLPVPQFSKDKPNHLENNDDNYENFYSQLQNFKNKTYHNNAPHNVKKCIKAVKIKYTKLAIVCSDFICKTTP